MKKDRINNVAIENGITPQVHHVDVNGATIDLQQYMDGCRFVASMNGVTDTVSAALYIELEIEESSDDSTWTDAADADVIGSVTGTTTGTFAVADSPADVLLAYQGQYVGIKRYCRVVVNLTGSHTGPTISCVAKKPGYKSPPVS